MRFQLSSLTSGGVKRWDANNNIGRELNNKLNLNDVIDEHENFRRKYLEWNAGRDPFNLNWLTGYLTALADVGKISRHDHIAMLNQLIGVIEKPCRISH